jgi:hypothetical protein
MVQIPCKMPPAAHPRQGEGMPLGNPHNDLPVDSERRARENRNKCRRPSTASYAGFFLARSGESTTTRRFRFRAATMHTEGASNAVLGQRAASRAFLLALDS